MRRTQFFFFFFFFLIIGFGNLRPSKHTYFTGLIFFIYFFFFNREKNHHKMLQVYYFTIQGMVKYCNRARKKCFFASFIRNISKTAETILIKKFRRNHGISIYKKALISEHQKIYIFRDNNCFVRMTVSVFFCQSLCYQIFVDELAQKLV